MANYRRFGKLVEDICPQTGGTRWCSPRSPKTPDARMRVCSCHHSSLLWVSLRAFRAGGLSSRKRERVLREMRSGNIVNRKKKSLDRPTAESPGTTHILIISSPNRRRNPGKGRRNGGRRKGVPLCSCRLVLHTVKLPRAHGLVRVTDQSDETSRVRGPLIGPAGWRKGQGWVALSARTALRLEEPRGTGGPAV